MEDNQQVIIEIETNYSEAVKLMAQYRAEADKFRQANADLKKELKEGKISQEEYNIQTAANTAQMKNASEAASTWERTVRNSLKVDQEKVGSLKQYMAQLSILTNQYKSLSEEERNSAEGVALKDKINEITDALKGSEEEIQLYQRNVGNYKQSIIDAVAGTGKFGEMIAKLAGSMGLTTSATAGATGALGAMNTQMLGLSMNPVVAILGVLATVIALIARTIKSSEDATNRWNVVLAPFKRMMDGLLSVLQSAVGQILSFVEAGGRMLNWAMKMGERLPIIGEQLKEVNAQNREAIAIAKEKADIDKQARTNEVDNAKDALRVAELRKQAKDKENNTAKERLAAVKEANAIEEQASKRNVELAERRLEVLKTESSWAENNKETNDELAKLEADVYRAKQEYFSKTMELLEQENTARNEIAAEEKARHDAAIAQAKERAAAIAEAKKTEMDELRKAEDMALELLTEGLAKQTEQINVKYDRQISDLKKRLDTEKNLTVDARKAINDQIILSDQLRAQELAVISQESIEKQIADEEALVKKRLEDTKKTAEEKAEQLRLEWENRLLRTRDGSMQEYELKVQQAQAEYDAILNMDAATKSALYASDEAYTNALLTNKKKLDDATKASNDAEQKAVEVKLQAAQAIGHGFQQVLEAFGEENSKLASLAKMIALFNIGLATAEAIAKGVAAAQSVPFPGNIAAIATTIGAVLTNIAQATKIVKSLKDPKPGSSGGSGGIANTTSVGSSSSNSVMSSAGRAVNSRGESSVPFEGAVSTIYSMQTRQQAENRSNGLDDSTIDKLADKLAKANEKIPAPIVDVREVTDKQRRVSVVEGGMKL